MDGRNDAERGGETGFSESRGPIWAYTSGTGSGGRLVLHAGDRLAKAERLRQDVVTAIERLRGVIRTRVHPREQGQFIDICDKVQEMVQRSTPEMETLQGTIARAKDTTRRILRVRPSDMVQLLNELEGVERDAVDYLNLLFRDVSG